VINRFALLHAPETSLCNGHGQCVNNVCICDSGWSGVSDIIGAPEQDCMMNNLAVGILWIPPAVVYLLCIIACLKVMPRPPPPALFWKQAKNSPTFRAAYMALVSGFFFFLNAIYKVSYLTQPIPALGHAIVPTIFYSIGLIFFYAVLANNVWLWCVASISRIKLFAAHKVQQQLSYLRIWCFTFIFLSLNQELLLFLIYGLPEHQVALGITFWILRGSLVFVYQFVERYLGLRLLAVLEECLNFDTSNTRQKSEEVLHRLSRATRDFFRRALISSAIISSISLLAGVWPFLRVQGGYIMPITQFFAAWTGLQSIKTLPRAKKEASPENTTDQPSRGPKAPTKVPMRFLSFQVQQETAAFEEASDTPHTSGNLTELPENPPAESVSEASDIALDASAFSPAARRNSDVVV